MARQFVTSVCMVCVLCAIHSHCAAHHNMAASASGTTSNQNHSKTSWHNSEHLSRGLHPQVESKLFKNTQTTRHKADRSDGTKVVTESEVTTDKRLRRDVDTDAEQRVFVRKMLAKFGDGESISYEGFREMLKSRPAELAVDATEKAAVRNATHNHTDECLKPQEMFTKHSSDDRLQSAALLEICPSLLYLLTAAEAEQAGCAEIHVEASSQSAEKEASAVQVWLYATLSIILISLCGLLGVAVIPIMKHMFYQQLLQFFVALAVGTLCGDALLHLLPHAMAPSHSHGDHHEGHHEGHHGGHEDEGHHSSDHDSNMYKGLVAAGGVVFLFFTEKCLALVAECRQRRQRRHKAPPRLRVMRANEQVLGDASVGEKLCKHKYSSYPYCYDEINTEITAEDNHHKHAHCKNTNNHTAAVVENHETGGGDASPRFPVHGICDGDNHGNHHHHDELAKVDDSGDRMIKIDEGGMIKIEESGDRMIKITGPPESLTVILREHENTHHGHSHTHGHVHSAPDSMSSVAWMVIMGDGLHNFTDGMAIGAAFAANIAGGFSTAIAVFCHELPHELGDFAVLLKAGMSAKQAVFYNVLSSVLCFFGMVVGVNAGSWESATQWIFAAAAGMFLYIALVDMIPELTSSHSKDGGSCCQCLLQVTGMLAGLGIMFTIAIYEEDLKTIFTDQG